MKGLSIKHVYCELFVIKVSTFIELKPSLFHLLMLLLQGQVLILDEVTLVDVKDDV